MYAIVRCVTVARSRRPARLPGEVAPLVTSRKSTAFASLLLLLASDDTDPSELNRRITAVVKSAHEAPRSSNHGSGKPVQLADRSM